MMQRSSTTHLLALLWLSALSLNAAYPEYYVENGHANGCTDLPTTGMSGHGDPTPDRATTFTLSKSGSRTPETAVCPGVAYDLVVDFAGARRRALIVASAGKFSSAGTLPADPKCPNRAASSSTSTTYTNKITLPCDAKGPRLLLNVSSSARSSDAFHKASTSLPITPVAQCPGSTCPGAPPAGAAAAAPAAAAAARAPAAQAAVPAAAAAAGAPAVAEPATRAAPAPTDAAAGAASLQRSAAGGCRPSPFKYACAVDAQQGATLHYTLSDSPTPPDNACTASAAAPAGGSSSNGQQQYLHMLLESPAQGYSGVGFPAVLGDMYPADAVIGYVDSTTGQPVVSAYHLTSFSVSKSPTNSNGLGWASALGAAKSGGNSLLCFSRPVDAPAAAVAKSLDTSALKLTLVGDSSTTYGSNKHELTNSLTLNAASGTATSAGASSKLAKQLAHGALMLLAFAVFMPLGALLARHKWIMGDKEKGGIRAGWFHVHRAVQSLAVLLALAGFILAVVAFNVPWSNMTASSTPHELYNAHRVLGVVVMVLSALQVIGGVMRPGLSHARRPNWRKGHTLMGWLGLAAGIVVVFMGAVMMHDMAGAPYINWMLPICLFVGLVLLAGIGAEVYKSKLERQGHYDPSTHTFLPSLGHPGSARSSGTGAPDVEVVGGTAKTDDVHTHML